MSTYTKKGFTLVELVIVIVVIGILATIAIVGFGGIQADSRDSQRSSSVSVIADSLEKYYDQHGEYPPCSVMTDPAASISALSLGTHADALKTPTEKTAQTSVICASDFTSSTPDAYVYIGDGTTACSGSASCGKWTIKYREEATGNIVAVSSRRVADGVVIPTAAATTVTTARVSTNVTGTPEPVTCSLGTPEYAISTRTNEGTWSSYTTWNTTRPTSTVAGAQGSKYEFRAQTRCTLTGYPSGTTSTSDIAAYIYPIATPSAPTVSANNTNEDSGVWTWASTCPAGTTTTYNVATYQDDATGWRAWGANTATASRTLTTSSQGYNYAVKARVFCSTTWDTSDTSAESNAPNYVRAIVTPGIATNFRFNTNTGSNSGTYPYFFNWDPPTCGTGTTRQWRGSYYILYSNSSQYGQDIFNATANAAAAFTKWSTTPSFTYNDVYWPRVDSNPAVAYGSSNSTHGVYDTSDVVKQRAFVQYRCINTVTSRVSEGGFTFSGLITR